MTLKEVVFEPLLAQTVKSMCDDCKKIHSIWRGYKESDKGEEPLYPIPINQVNNQNNIMFDQCIHACANKGLPSSMHYSYQWPTKVCLPACTTHINGLPFSMHYSYQWSAFQHALLISMVCLSACTTHINGLPSSMHYSYQWSAFQHALLISMVCLPACTTHINGLPSSMHYSYQWSAFQHALLISMVCLPACTTHINGLPSSMHYSYQWSAFQHALLISMVCLPACTTHINGLPSSMHYSYQWASSSNSTLLEEEYQLLDVKLALQLSTDAELITASYEEYATAVRELTACKEQLKVYNKNTAI